MADANGKKFFGIRQIAQLAGVSTATVSRVLNSPESTTEAVRKKVMDVVEEYDYVPNQSAKNLFSGQANSIALFVYDMANPFYISIIKHLNNIAFENNYTMLVCDAEDSFDREMKFYNYCKSIRVSGIIYTAGSTRDSLGADGKVPAFPVVVIDREGFKDKKCYSVKADHEKGMSLLVEYLYNLNHRKIGFVTGPMTILSARERLNSFLLAMKKLNLEVPEHYIKRGNYSVTSGIEAFDYFHSLPDKPTAIITSNDQNAQGVILRANSLGVKVPEEFSICGYDGINLDNFFPVITSIKQDTVAISAAAFDNIIRSETTPPPLQTLIDVSINMGTTCRSIER
ncbi:MAG: LacI family DNA-binding transcriptional regulator [Christensenellaceae bacterium]